MMEKPLSDKADTSNSGGEGEAVITLRRSVLRALCAVLLLSGVMLGGTLHRGYDLWQGENFFRGETSFLRSDMERSARNIEFARQQAQDHLTALTMRVAELQTRVLRLDALGQKIAQQQNLKTTEFDFSGQPAMGGPETLVETDESRPDFMQALDQLASDVARREEQLAVLDKLLVLRKRDEAPALEGRPVRTGWMTSRFGRRVDPFNGRLAMHEGVDFAGQTGDDIVSVGEGVVTWAGERFGYGLLVEVNHGNGYTTRYGHARDITVKVGDLVKSGQLIARMGNSGRSTGTHLHFEIRRDGVALNPSRILFGRG